MTHLPAFKTWLISKNYKSTTIRNYLVDINKFYFFASNQNNQNIFDEDLIASYISSLQKDKNNQRYISSLNKFFQFTLDQGLHKSNPLKKIKKKLHTPPRDTAESLILEYQKYLQKKHKTIFTIKNYINDVKQFINFCES
jgi:site-specific recombinase XerC